MDGQNRQVDLSLSACAAAAWDGQVKLSESGCRKWVNWNQPELAGAPPPLPLLLLSLLQSALQPSPGLLLAAFRKPMDMDSASSACQSGAQMQEGPNQGQRRGTDLLVWLMQTYQLVRLSLGLGCSPWCHTAFSTSMRHLLPVRLKGHTAVAEPPQPPPGRVWLT